VRSARRSRGDHPAATTCAHASDPAKAAAEKGILYSDEWLKAVPFGFARGEALSKHTDAMPAVLHFLQGEARLAPGDGTPEVKPGTGVNMPKGLRHGTRTLTPVAILLQLVR
jgi:quercetin dioxygenase-like cupin family protein